jgi:hypothetical protein
MSECMPRGLAGCGEREREEGRESEEGERERKKGGEKNGEGYYFFFRRQAVAGAG